MRPAALLSFCVLPFAFCVAAGQEPAGGGQVYKKGVPSVVWVISDRGSRGQATGSGSLIDVSNRLVLTNYHVVGDEPNAKVMFPHFRTGEAVPVAERQFYKDRARREGIPGRVVRLDKQHDLALIRLDRLQPGARAIPLAGGSPGPGDTVHSIGNAGASGALFGYVRGTVRQVYHKRWAVNLDGRTARFDAEVIETDSPTNPGDSGGPLLNDKGELVGVTQGGVAPGQSAQSISYFIDARHVRRLHQEVAGRAAGDRPATAAKPGRRATPVPVADKAKVFSPEAVKKAEEAVAELHRRGLDLLIETYPSPPDDRKDKVRDAKGEARRKVLREWANDRQKAEKAQGVAILVVMSPGSLVVEVDDPAKGKFPEGFANTVSAALVKAFGAKKYDDGLAEAVKLVRDEYKGPKDPGKETAAKETPKPGRPAPAPVADKAKVFGPDAVKKAEEAVAELHKRGLDVLVETHPAAPDEWREKAKSSPLDVRKALFKEWAEKRLADEKAAAVVFVFADPRYAGVEIAEGARDRFPDGYAGKVADALTKGLREKKPDDGLAAALALLRDGLKGGPK